MSSAIVKPCYVYLLYSRSAERPKSYVGWSMDVESRLHKHNAGRGAKATRGAQWQLVHVESYLTRGEAMAAEYRLKKDRKRRQALINTFLQDNAPPTTVKEK